MWSDKLKINKQLSESMADLGYSSPKTIQELAMTRIAGGQDVVGIGPEGSGKTTTYIISVLMKLKYAFEEAPRALVLVPDRERVATVVEKFQLLGKNTTIRVLGVISGVGMDPQMDALADGTDVIVGTPDRVRALYLKLGLNLNKIQMFILDDAELLIKQGMQLPVIELARSLPKCQHLVFTEVIHEKLRKLIDPFLNFPQLIEVNDFLNPEIETFNQQLYHIPNFKTKLNLLSFLLSDSEKYPKTVVFVNTKANAERVMISLRQRIGEEVALFRPDFDEEGLDSLPEFKDSKDKRVLLIANERFDEDEFVLIPFVIHLELPVDKETYIRRIERRALEVNQSEPVFIAFATDIELSDIKKVENVIGKKMELMDLPIGLKIEREEDKRAGADKSETKHRTESQTSGAAFHEKKESNNKQYNYGYKDKMKMAGKISKRRNK